MTLVQTIQQRAKAYPDRPAIIAADGAVTPYNALELPDDFACGLSTSGTTATPKKVVLADEHVQRRLARFERVRGPAFAKLTRLFAPFSYQNAIGAHLAACMFLKGGTLFTGGATFDPKGWLDMCQKYEVEGACFVPKLPLFWSLLDVGHDYRFANVYVHGGAASKDQLEMIRDRLGGSVWINYGVTEIGQVAGGSMEQVADIPGCVGYVDSDLEVEIVKGEIRIRSNAMASGYATDPELTAQKFKDGWFYPGDLGHFEKGMLVIDGRA